MAQAGTDVFVVLPAITSVFVAPCNLTLLSAAAGLGTVGSTLSTLTVVKNAVPTAITPTCANAANAGAHVAGPVSLVAGDVVTFTAALGTSAATPSVSLWLQRVA